MTSLKAWNPIGRLTVDCLYPKEESLVFHRQWGKRFSLLSRPGEVFEVAEVSIHPEVAGLDRFVSDGAIVGAAVASFWGRDTLRGALVGHWLEKRYSPKGTSRDFLLILREVSSGDLVELVFSLTPDDCKTVYQYFLG